MRHTATAISQGPCDAWVLLRSHMEELVALAVVAAIARVPAESVSGDDRTRLKNLDADLRRHIFGQGEAIESIVAAIRLSRAGLRLPGKPVGSFLFFGPTGVGKTYLACALANRACRMGFSAFYIRIPKLFQDLAIARGDGSYPKFMRKLLKYRNFLCRGVLKAFIQTPNK